MAQVSVCQCDFELPMISRCEETEKRGRRKKKRKRVQEGLWGKQGNMGTGTEEQNTRTESKTHKRTILGGEPSRVI